MTRRRRATLPALAVLALLGAAGLAGAAGLVIAGQVLAILAVVGAAAPAVRPPRPPRSRAAESAYELGRRQWSSLYRIESAVVTGMSSRRHFDLALRPRLQRVLRSVAIARRGVDVAARPDAGRTLVGADLWPLVDPDRPAERDSSPGGVELARVQQLLDRIEQL